MILRRGTIAAGMREGICRLCLNQGPLQESHILPKALYRYLLASGGSAPVVVTRGVGAHQTNKQVKADLLCSSCEKTLNDNGEGWMLSHGYRGRHRFRLRDILLRAKPLGPMHDGFVYSALDIAELDVARIAYYASSVFWRASVCPSDEREHQMTLGKHYEEEFRGYLCGRTGFPSSAALMVEVSNTESPIQVFSFPFSQHHTGGYHQHSFFAQGVLFRLFVGGKLPPKLDLLCIVRSKGQVIFLSDKIEGVVQSGSIELMADAMRKQGYKVADWCDDDAR